MDLKIFVKWTKIYQICRQTVECEFK